MSNQWDFPVGQDTLPEDAPGLWLEAAAFGLGLGVAAGLAVTALVIGVTLLASVVLAPWMSLALALAWSGGGAALLGSMAIWAYARGSGVWALGFLALVFGGVGFALLL